MMSRPNSAIIPGGQSAVQGQNLAASILSGTSPNIQYTIHLDSSTRNKVLEPQTNPCTLNLDPGNVHRGSSNMYVSSIELPFTFFTIQEPWQNFTFDEGIELRNGDEGRIVQITYNDVPYTVELPMYLNPIDSVTVDSATSLTFTTAFPHGLQFSDLWTFRPIQVVNTCVPFINVSIASGTVTLLSDTQFQVTGVTNATCFGAIGDTVSGNIGILTAPAIPGPVELAYILTQAFARIGFTFGQFVYDTNLGYFILQTSSSEHVPPSLVLQLTPLVQCMGFPSCGPCASTLTKLPSGLWAIQAQLGIQSKGFATLVPAFYQAIQDLGAEISLELNRLWFDSFGCSSPPSSQETFLWSNAIGTCLSFQIPFGKYFPDTFAAFLQERMNTLDPLSQNAYVVAYSASAQAFTFSNPVELFGLEFGDLSSTATLPMRLGFNSVAYRGSNFYSSDKQVSFARVGCPQIFSRNIYNVIASTPRRQVTLESTGQRPLPVQVTSVTGNSATLTVTGFSAASGLQPDDLINLYSATGALIGIAHVNAVTSAFIFEIDVDTLPVLTPGTDVVFSPERDPTVFDIYFAGRRKFNGLRADILGFEPADLSGGGPYQSPNNFNISPPLYLLLQVPNLNSSQLISHQSPDGDNAVDILAKFQVGADFQQQRLWSQEFSFPGNQILTNVQFRWLTPYHDVVNLRGRNWSMTMTINRVSDSPAFLCQ
eukprot:gnl/Hemi2/14039_TR4772_c0_g1_i1.p1 gnl/Hemi2/14039_TR4772_c0_g1~~gnl/Hemi2/14039_TR4772_c0_g1_i1.p1  ORF type:complete len:710 (-),score=148.52 gnl/Hemi2/14039_TR4772_c0_g1_i1:86-2215(-)